ncbi:MAG: LCP family protein [Chloroflexi bacterium]|nr:LCP family protein [Chloroflexota bacterium]
MLSALLPGLGQIYDGRWTRGILMLAIPFFFLSLLAFAVLFGGPLASAVIQRAALFALIVVGALFGYHLAIVGDAFAGGMRSPRGRHAIDYAILAAIVLGLVVAYYSAYRQATAWANVVAAVFEPASGRTLAAGTPTGGTTAPGWSGRERLNVLLLGIDTREESPQTQNTDTLIVLSIEPTARTAAMLSIPRDTVVDIPGVGKDKVNAAYAHAQDARKGPELARRTVERFLGIPIHSYAIIDFTAFRQTIESVGGVLVDLPRPLRDEAYPTADFGVERFELRAGPQLMDGENALRYARSRHDSNDFTRARRQQLVLFALRDRFALAGLFRLPGIIERVGPLVRTNFDPGNVLPLARTALAIERSEIVSEVLLPCGGDAPHCELTEENGPLGYYLIPDVAKVRALVADLFAGRTPASAP